MSRVVKRPWLPVVLVLLLAAGVLLVRVLPRDTDYHAELPHAAGLRPGDPVRVAGLQVGEVTAVTAEGATVHVDFHADEDVRLTEDTVTQVKLASLLGQHYLDLQPGTGSRLDTGGTIPRREARGTYTMDRFWLDATPQVDRLDLRTLQQAVDTLTGDLRTAPTDVRRALDGMTAVSRIVSSRDRQLGDLLTSTRAVTDTLLDQQDELDALVRDADQVMTMVFRRREAIRLLLRDSHRLVVQLTALTRRNQHRLDPALRDARRVLGVLTRHREQLDRLLELAGPSMRFFTNSTGDGPWLGVNSPYFVFPDDFVCTSKPQECR